MPTEKNYGACDLCHSPIVGSRRRYAARHCEHHFHTQCIHEHRAKSNMCPASDCGAPLDIRKVHGQNRVAPVVVIGHPTTPAYVAERHHPPPPAPPKSTWRRRLMSCWTRP